MREVVSPLLRIDNVCKSFGERTILDRVSLDVNPGQLVVLVGRSGSGKSTLLRCINGLETIESGSIVIEGRQVPRQRRQLLEMRRRIGMIFQSFNLYPHLTARENVTLAPRRILGLGRAEADACADELFAKVRLTHRASAYPSELSGGEQQRVAIARALAMQPSLLLFDEPTSALDPETVGDVLDVMESLAAEGRTMVVVTHEMGFARHAGDKIAFMADGCIVEEGTPSEIMDQPKMPDTQRFFQSILRA